MIRDTARYRPYQKAHGKAGGKLQGKSLKKLSLEHLERTIQEGQHHPVRKRNLCVRHACSCMSLLFHQLKLADYRSCAIAYDFSPSVQLLPCAMMVEGPPDVTLICRRPSATFRVAKAGNNVQWPLG